jgi:hypothetical protein
MRIVFIGILSLFCSLLCADFAPPQETAGSGSLTRTEKINRLRSSKVWREAERSLKARGINENQTSKALEEMPDGKLKSLLVMAEIPQRGGFLDLLLFILLVALIVWLILILLDPWYWRYRY